MPRSKLTACRWIQFAWMICAAALIFLSTSNLRAQEKYLIMLNNGMQLGPGIVTKTNTISQTAFALGSQGAEAQVQAIGVLDDELRYTYFNAYQNNLANMVPSTAAPEERIVLPSKVEAEKSGGTIAIGGVANVTEFNEHGRRIYSIFTYRGRQDLLQGITELTASYASVEVLRGQKASHWDMRLATSSIPADKLLQILQHELDLTKPNEWMRMVRFYIQGQHFGEARKVLSQAIAKFPELADRASQLEQLNQMIANKAFQEIELRRRNGQHQFAANWLKSLSGTDVTEETKLKVEDQIADMQRQLTQVSQIVEQLRKHTQSLPPADQAVIQPIVEELSSQVGFDSLARLADYERLREDATIPFEQKVAFAIGGWLLGPGAGIDNLAVVKSLVRVRALVQEYLASADPARRQGILAELSKEEGGRPDLVAKLVATMQPPMPLPPAASDDPKGFYRLSAATDAATGNTTEYAVQLPAEYDPNRKYPCIVTLPGAGLSPELQINWWAGNYDAKSQMRHGFASRHGYIVVSPNWIEAQQVQYNYTEGEHAKVLSCFRDALRHLSIDSDRVFVSGHMEGATAAWDLALSHPDLWAGAVMVSPSADKFILHYEDNARYVPTYFVYGEHDASGLREKLGATIDKYIKRPKHDCLAVEYRGRGREHFYEELPRIIQWLELSSHRRNRAVSEIDVATMRPGDRFFYWLETPELNPDAVTNAFLFEPKTSGIKAKLLDPKTNGVLVSRLPAKRVWIWLSPDMVDFARPIQVTLYSKKKVFNLAPSIAILLEDVRTRGDRQAPFFQKIELP